MTNDDGIGDGATNAIVTHFKYQSGGELQYPVSQQFASNWKMQDSYENIFHTDKVQRKFFNWNLLASKMLLHRSDCDESK